MLGENASQLTVEFGMHGVSPDSGPVLGRNA